MHAPLELTLVLLACAVAAVATFRKLQLPPMLGYLAVGAVVGPYALNVAGDGESMHALSQFGVVFLMFSIGLEFSYTKLKSMRRIVFGLGLSQVFLSIAWVLLLSVAGAYFFPAYVKISWQSGFAMGAAMAMSSTAIVTKLLSERMELETEHGRRIFGVLLFQDLALVPLLILVPALAENPNDLLSTLSIAFGKAVIAMLFLLFLGKFLINWWLGLIAKQRSQELFMLNLLLITLGAAWFTEFAGLSMELGAFIAGMLIAETQYKHQVEVDIQSFRDVLLGLFFVTVGMLLNIPLVIENWWLVLILVIGPLLFKFTLITGLAKFFGSNLSTSLRIGIALAQAGEFGFVLLNEAGGLNLVDPFVVQVILASMVLSMFISPFLIAQSDRIVMRLSSNEWMAKSLALTNIAAQTMVQQQHVIIVGFGRAGQSVAMLLQEQNISSHALDLDPERVQQAQLAGASVSYGDASRRENLIVAGIHRAAALVIAFSNVREAEKIMHFVHELAPNLPIVVRSLDGDDFDQLKEAGASEVVPEALESSLVLALFTMRELGVPTKRVVRVVQNERKKRYASLRGFFHSSSADPREEGLISLRSVALPPNSKHIEQPVSALGLDTLCAELMAVRRHGKGMTFSAKSILQNGDVLVLRGTAECLLQAEQVILS